MIEIGGKPMLWHILKLYAGCGINDFIVCLGYKGYVIKEYFANYFMHTSDVTFDIANNEMQVHKRNAEPWRITLVDTGEATATGGRLKRVAQYLKEDEEFCFTYGDGVANIDFQAQIAFHRKHGRLATVTAVRPPGRYGTLGLADRSEVVESFVEKPSGDGGWINGGFFVVSSKVIDYIASDQTAWELEPLARLTAEKQLMAYRHEGFWHAMDTLRDKTKLEELWASGNAPWQTWT
jgi:glucose-1-phosphate cytidylyltransferase